VPERPSSAKRSTRQGAAVEETLRRLDGFRTAQQVFAEVAAAGHRVGLTTVYRHLNLLAEQGRADVVHLEDGEAQFRLCGEPADGEHHHHVVCRVCGRSQEVSGPEVERWAERVARAAGYTEVTHTLEVFGVCSRHAPDRPAKRGRGRTA
jgi:Fur family ferric uptake transcriptional regulator